MHSLSIESIRAETPCRCIYVKNTIYAHAVPGGKVHILYIVMNYMSIFYDYGFELTE